MKHVIMTTLVGLVLAGLPTPTWGQGFDPRAYQKRVAGEATQIMVLGTAHLGGAPEGWRPEVLEPLLARLESFRPDVIAIEAQPGPTLAKIWQYREILPEAAATFGGTALRMAMTAGINLDMDMPQAEAAVRRQMAAWPANPTPADRRRLAALFAAAGDPNSALVQWWRLPEAERVAGDGVFRILAGQLDALAADTGENAVLAARLAVRLGLERVWQTDSQEEDVFTPEEADLFYKTVFPGIGERFDADPVIKGRGRVERMTDGEATLAEFRKLNAAAVNRRSSEVEWQGVIDRPTDRDVGRKRMAAWEARNLRMAANIREASARAPGRRVLVIVGAAHKIWLEAYLGMMADVRIVSTDTVLK